MLAMFVTKSAERLQEYQRNTAYAGFMVMVCFGAFCYLTEYIRVMIVPLIWSCFFAVPMVGIIEVSDRCLMTCASWVHKKVFYGGEVPRTLRFEAWSDSHEVTVSREEPIDEVLARVNEPCGSCWITSCLCRRRLRVKEVGTVDMFSALTSSPVSLSSQKEEDPLATAMATYGPQVNRLCETWLYYVTEQDRSAAQGQAGPRRLALFLDRNGHYPAVLGPEEGDETEAFPVQGMLEINNSSPMSYGIAVFSSVLFVLMVMILFSWFIALSVNDFRNNLENYEKGIQDVIDWAEGTFGDVLPKETWQEIQSQLENFARNMLPDLAKTVLGDARHFAWQAVLFMIYLGFWISEPLPFNNNVAQVFKSYLVMKSCVCLLYGGLMSALLFMLGCRLWHIFFVICFMLNYIPEVGAVLAGALMLPAVLFDGNVPIDRRIWNVARLIVVGGFFKVLTGNVLEVRIYASRGGQFMRIHPVILVALMMLCSAMLGVTGLFLAIPIIGALKYYILSADMPHSLLHPLLTLIEGDRGGPHKNFVDRRRALMQGHPFPGRHHPRLGRRSNSNNSLSSPSSSPGRDAREANALHLAPPLISDRG